MPAVKNWSIPSWWILLRVWLPTNKTRESGQQARYMFPVSFLAPVTRPFLPEDRNGEQWPSISYYLYTAEPRPFSYLVGLQFTQLTSGCQIKEKACSCLLQLLFQGAPFIQSQCWEGDWTKRVASFEVRAPANSWTFQSHVAICCCCTQPQLIHKPSHKGQRNKGLIVDPQSLHNVLSIWSPLASYSLSETALNTWLGTSNIKATQAQKTMAQISRVSKSHLTKTDSLDLQTTYPVNQIYRVEKPGHCLDSVFQTSLDRVLKDSPLKL